MLRSRKRGWNEGRGCSLMESSWIVQCSRQKGIRWGAQGGLSCGSLGCCCVSSLQRQNACLCGLQVNCSWGTERRKSHHRKRRDYRRLNTEDYTFRLPPRNAPHANESGFQKERERKKSRRNSFVTICSGENTSSVTKLRERESERVHLSVFVFANEWRRLWLAGCQMGCKHRSSDGL